VSWTTLVLCTSLGAARGLDVAGAAVAVAATPAEGEWSGTLLLDLRSSARAPRGTLLASPSARGLERRCSEEATLRAAARGRLCFATRREPTDPAECLRSALGPDLGASLVVCLCDPADFRSYMRAGAEHPRTALLRAAPGSDRSLLALLTAELLAAAVPLKAWVRPIGLVPARRALPGERAAGSPADSRRGWRRRRRIARGRGSGRSSSRRAARRCPACSGPRSSWWRWR
jgi:hypothetical protein